MKTVLATVTYGPPGGVDFTVPIVLATFDSSFSRTELQTMAAQLATPMLDLGEEIKDVQLALAE